MLIPLREMMRRLKDDTFVEIWNISNGKLLARGPLGNIDEKRIDIEVFKIVHLSLVGEKLMLTVEDRGRVIK